eukprot:1783888-Lingulodinium_polyedra.AAC.1
MSHVVDSDSDVVVCEEQDLLEATVKQESATCGEQVLEDSQVPAAQPEPPASFVADIKKLLTERSQSQPEVAPEEDNTGDPVFAALKACNGGKFDLKGTVLGNKWYRSFRESPELKQDYEQCRGREAQQKFRAAWASELWS